MGTGLPLAAELHRTDLVVHTGVVEVYDVTIKSDGPTTIVVVAVGDDKRTPVAIARIVATTIARVVATAAARIVATAAAVVAGVIAALATRVAGVVAALATRVAGVVAALATGPALAARIARVGTTARAAADRRTGLRLRRSFSRRRQGRKTDREREGRDCRCSREAKIEILDSHYRYLLLCSLAAWDQHDGYRDFMSFQDQSNLSALTPCCCRQITVAFLRVTLRCVE